uniref:RNA helicase n=2 Tax=Mesocestoides corti TaxID=53468 RepID=A0A5K3FHS5_MESCO
MSEIDAEPDIDGLAHNLDSLVRTSDVITPNATASQTSLLSFSDMGLSVNVLKGLRQAGFQRPSPVQVKAIPLGRLGVDLIVQAKSGTGKTVVFSVVTLETIDVKKKGTQAIIISPTRETAFQSASVISQLGRFIDGLRVRLFVGGIPLSEDIKSVQNCHVAVGTPGRLKYLINAGHMNCEDVRLLVLDEADLLFSGGAGPDTTDTELLAGKNTFPSAINYIWWALPESKQVLALSATYSEHLVEHHLPRYLRSPALVRLSANDPSLLGVRQFFHKVPSKSTSPAALFKAKIKELLRILKDVDFRQCLVFSNFHNSAEQLCETLRNLGWPIAYISSGLDQKERFRAFNSLRAFQCRILVSTDLTSRGVDAENVNLVIHLEVPWNRDIYLHRIGRAGRFGSYGASILLVSDASNEMSLLSRVEDPNSTPILLLPDPIPADLTTSECQIDVSSLVSVTELPTTAQRHSHNQEVFKKVDRPSKKSVVSIRPSSGKKTVLTSACSAKELNLEGNLKSYVEAIKMRPSISAYLTMDEEARQSVPPSQSCLPKFSVEVEHAVLHQLSEFLRQPLFTRHKATKELLEAAGKEEELEQPLEISESRESVEHDRSSSPYRPVVANAPQTRTLTHRQMALWNEYCRLVGWKDYFYQAWWNVSREYEAALAEYKAAVQLNSGDAAKTLF